MSHGGMSPRGGLSDVSAGAETLREGEPAPFADAYDLAEAPVRVTLAETREQVLRSFLRERGDRGGTAPSSVDALLDSMEAARRGTSVMLVRPHERAPARASDDAFSFGRVIRSGSANVDDPDGDPSSVRGGGSAEADAFGIDSIDTRAAARWLEHTVPIVVIILVSFLLKRAASLATFAWTTAVFLKANDVLKRGVSIGVHTHTERPIDSDVRDEEEGENTLGASRRRSSTSRETSPNDAVNSASNAARTSETEPSLARSQTERHTNLSARAISDSKDDLRNGSINEKKRFAALLAALALSGGAVGVLAKAFPNESFWDAFFFRAQTNALAEKKTGTGGDAIADSDSVSFLDHLWRAAMADLIARLATVGVKACVLMLFDRRLKSQETKNAKKDSKNFGDENKTPRSAAATRARAARAARLRRRAESHRLAFIEHVSLTVRTAMPVGTWFAYFMRGAYATRKRGTAVTGVFLFAPPSDVARLGACLAAGTYSAVKVKAFLERFLALRLVTVVVLEAASKDPTGLGSGARESVSSEISNAGNECTVCCDAFESPVTLTCGHVFCEKCVGAWFERSRKCPLCRAVVAPKHCGVVEHGDGATVAWPYAF